MHFKGTAAGWAGPDFRLLHPPTTVARSGPGHIYACWVGFLRAGPDFRQDLCLCGWDNKLSCVSESQVMMTSIRRWWHALCCQIGWHQVTADLEFICHVCRLVICILLFLCFLRFKNMCIAVYITACIAVCLSSGIIINK